MPINAATIEAGIGFADVYVDCTAPASFVSMTHTAGLPTGGRHVGATEGESTFRYAATLEGIQVEQLTGPVAPRVMSEEASIVCTLLEHSYDNLLVMLGQGTGSTGGGVNLIQLGGKFAVPSRCVVLIGLHANAAKYDIATIYKCISMQGVAIATRKNEPRRQQVTFTGVHDHARAQGDQLAQYQRGAA
jgi:hypothetical protein